MSNMDSRLRENYTCLMIFTKLLDWTIKYSFINLLI